MGDQTANYLCWAELGASMAEMSERQLRELPPNRGPVVHASIGSSGLMAAIGQLMLG